jgi:hypothetical protein
MPARHVSRPAGLGSPADLGDPQARQKRDFGARAVSAINMVGSATRQESAARKQQGSSKEAGPPAVPLAGGLSGRPRRSRSPDWFI